MGVKADLGQKLDPLTFSFREAAEYLGVSERQFRNIAMAYPARLPVFNLLPGGHPKVSKKDIDAYIEWRKIIGPEGDG